MASPVLSTIIPIYNVDKYLEDAIQSVIGQSIGFDAIQLLLIDDGSTDTSSSIAKKYADLYPQNITYKHQKNSGVSSARNLGFTMATGRYVHFFDGDDLLSKDYYRESIDFLERNDVDFVASKIKFFDEIINSHPLNYKFGSTRVIDLEREKQNPLVHVITCIFKRDSIHGVKFDTELSIAEDMKFIGEVARKTHSYGVLKKPTYFYRKRGDGSSAIASSRRNDKYYLPVVRRVYKKMLDDWRQTDGGTSPIEYTILYDLSYRLDQAAQDVLSTEHEAQYKSELLAVATGCSVEAIVNSKFLSTQQKIYLLKNKYGKDFAKHLEYVAGKVFVDGHHLSDLSGGVFLDFLDATSENKYRAEGYIENFLDLAGVKYYIDISSTRSELKFVARKQLEKSFLGDVYQRGGAFEVDVDVAKDAVISFGVRAKDWSSVLRIHTGPFTRFGALKLTYRRDSDRLFKRKSHQIVSSSYSTQRHVYLELRMMLQIVLNWRFGTVRERLRRLSTYNLKQLSLKGKLVEIAKPWFFMAEAIFYIPRGIFLRIIYYIAKRFKKRPIWLVSDRGMAAGDNGEAFFRYVNTQKDCPADVYFVISKRSKDLTRIQSIGKVIYQESFAYKIKFLLADKVIASQADVETTNPFIRQRDHYGDLFNFNFVFLQHGIIRHNLSDWLNRFNKNIRLFVTSADKEYDSMFVNPYYYPRENILLSGLPRYDYLESEPKGKLILAPTYRKNLVHMKTNRIGDRGYDAAFKSSQYYSFYDNLMNDHRLLTALEGAGMTGEFYLHPVFSKQRSDFHENERFKVMAFPYSYKEAFRDGNIMISDHSSVMFDFAYLKKPVAYAHFDVGTFFEGHSYSKSNFFSDEEDGFGDVCYDYDSLVESVIKTIGEKCVMPKKYQQRIEDFFAYTDTNNCKRVYDAIIDLDKK